MKTQLFSLITAVAISSSIYAQDIIVLKNGNELKVKVLEVSPAEIKYKKFDNLDGPTYSDLKSSIFMIKYESGVKDVFNKQATSAPTVSEVVIQESKEAFGYQPDLNDLSNYKNNDLIVTTNGDSIKCVIDQVTKYAVAYHILRSGMDARASVNMSSVSNYYNNPVLKETTFTLTGTPQMKEGAVAQSKEEKNVTEDDDEFLPEVRRYSGPRVGATYADAGAFQRALVAEGKNYVYSQFGWQFEKRLFTTKTGISSVLEFVPLIGGIDMGKFIPSASLLLGLRVKSGYEFGVGPTVAVYGARDANNNINTSTSVGIVLSAGMSFKSDKVYFPVNIAFIPSVGKKAYYTDQATGAKTSKTYQTGAKISLLVGFNYRKR